MPVLSRSAPLSLASASPRRRELLASVGIPLVVCPVTIDERQRGAESAEGYIERVVADKLEAGRAARGASSPALLVADTVVVCDGELLHKPETAAASRAMIERIAGRAHEVKTRFIVEREPARAVARTVSTRVFVRALPAAWIDAYVATGEGMDKAGGYAVQGKFAFAVDRIEGSYTNVVGLPLSEVVAALDELGLLSGILSS